MVNFKPTKKTKHLVPWKQLLGKSIAEIIPYTGEPFASYHFHGEEVFLYDTGSISTVVFRNGVVVRCDDLAETRRTLRITPSEKVPALLIGERKITGYLKDLSVAGAAFHFTNHANFAIGSVLDISFALSIEGISRFFQISCRVHDDRAITHEKAAIVLFDLTGALWKKRLLSRYVQLSSISTELDLRDPFLTS
ncbi:MAG: PilZ domain-containing protein [Geobacteraceae bacterium]